MPGGPQRLPRPAPTAVALPLRRGRHFVNYGGDEIEIVLAKSCCSCQADKTRGTPLGTRRFQEPGNDSPHIDGDGGQDVLEVGPDDDMRLPF